MAKKKIWDLPVRIVHWALAILILGSWYTVEVSGDMDTHMLIGQVILSLVAFRIVWGFVGTRYARFSSFVFGPAEILANAKSLLKRGGSRYAGHNPLGGLAVVLLLGLVLVQVSTGLFATDGDFYEGPLSELVSTRAANQITGIHESNFNILLILIGVHIAAAIFYLIYKRQNLIAPMIVGGKEDEDGSLEPIVHSKLWLAAGLYSLVAATVYIGLHVR
jgi:cytochrome b